MRSVEATQVYANSIGRVIIKLGDTELVGMEPEDAEHHAQLIMHHALKARQIRAANKK